MSYLESLCAARASGPAAWLEFSQRVAREPDAIFLFVEGRLDMAYYPAMVRRYVGALGRPAPLNCGGRDGVLWAKLRIEAAEIGKERCLYFIDKDYGDLLGDDSGACRRLFVTEVHSVENYLVTAEAVEIIWTEIWGLSGADETLAAVRRAFIDGYERLARGIRPGTAWIVVALGSGARCVLSELGLECLVTIDEDGLPTRRRRALDRMRAATQCTTTPSVPVLLNVARVLRRTPVEGWIRGKYAFGWFCRFMDRVRGAVKGAPKAALCTPEILGPLLASKVSASEQLRTFLERMNTQDAV